MDDMQKFLNIFSDTLYVAIPFNGGALLHSKKLLSVLEMNTNQKKNGAYFTVNGFARFVEGDYHGRTKANVTSFNGNFLDIDLTPETRRTQAELIYKDLCDKGLPPTAVVLTGKGLHVYWMYAKPFEVNEKTLKEYEALQSAIVEHFRLQGADPQARDAARVLRIPGAKYFNKKGEYECDVELMKFNPDTKYAPDTIALFFKDSIRIDTEEGKKLLGVSDDFDVSSILEVKIGNRHKQAYSAALSIIQRAKSLADARVFFNAILSKWESPSNDPLDWNDCWNQFEEAKRFLEKDRPQLFLGDKEGNAITYKTAADVVVKPLEWLWDGVLLKGKSHMLIGNPDLGKSQITIDIAARISRGDSFPSYTLTSNKKEPMGVIILSAEDEDADTIVPRLMAAGADLSKVFILSSTVIEKNKDGKAKLRSLALRDDAEQILKTIATIPCKVGLLIIDPISAFLSSSQDSNSNSDARGTMGQLRATVMEKGIAILMINHNNKNVGIKSALARSMGSTGWGADARVTLHAFKDSDERNVLSFGKMNLAKREGNGFFYKIKAREIDFKEGFTASLPYIEWVSDEFPTKTADDYSGQSNAAPKPLVADECLMELELFMEGKPFARTDDVLEYMTERGFTRNEVNKAARKMNIIGHERGIWKR